MHCEPSIAQASSGWCQLWKPQMTGMAAILGVICGPKIAEKKHGGAQQSTTTVLILSIIFNNYLIAPYGQYLRVKIRRTSSRNGVWRCPVPLCNIGLAPQFLHEWPKWPNNNNDDDDDDDLFLHLQGLRVCKLQDLLEGATSSNKSGLVLIYGCQFVQSYNIQLSYAYSL